ncbi:adenylosuccinate lyase, partial [Sulfolobus sp. A20-N-F6]
MEDIVCPLDWRYGSKEMRSLFSKEGVLRKRVLVEIALLKALNKIGLAKEDDIKKVEEVSYTIKPEEVDDLE